MTFYNQFVPKELKYKNKSTVYDGRTYHSMKEAGYAGTLDMLKRATNPKDRVTEWKPQHIIDIYLDGVIVTTRPTSTKLFRIIPDFLVTFADGHQEIHEVKSNFTKTMDWKHKWKILEAVYGEEYPEIDLKVIN